MERGGDYLAEYLYRVFVLIQYEIMQSNFYQQLLVPLPCRKIPNACSTMRIIIKDQVFLFFQRPSPLAASSAIFLSRSASKRSDSARFF